jgi:HAE1 family hydrophobic/amphiphilic exporter-1
MAEDGAFIGVADDSGDTVLQAEIRVDRDKARQLGLDADGIRAVLNAGFARRQAATIHRTDDSYRVLMEYDVTDRAGIEGLDAVAFRSANGALVPLSAFATVERGSGPRAIAQLGQLAVATISFDLAQGIALGDALKRIDDRKRDIGVPSTVVTRFVGTARVFQDMMRNQPLLLAAAVLAIYIVLGILYESLLHPLTILAGLPSAAIGAVAALMIYGMSLDIMGLIGILLLFGIVKKNAIMMIDVAIQRRRAGEAADRAIRAACLLRFRPILMTTLVAMAGAVPVAIGHGAGAELRQPLGVAVIGGLAVSQVLTLFVTPVLYLYLEKLSDSFRRAARGRAVARVSPEGEAQRH